MTESLWLDPHHDGSELYVPDPNPVLSYRWLLDGGPVGYRWLNGAGCSTTTSRTPRTSG